MPRKPRVEYVGAIYHVMSRGNRGDAIFLDEKDHQTFIDTLEEACTKTGWLVHAVDSSQNALVGLRPYLR
jgi:hypothetical protein